METFSISLDRNHGHVPAVIHSRDPEASRLQPLEPPPHPSNAHRYPPRTQPLVTESRKKRQTAGDRWGRLEGIPPHAPAVGVHERHRRGFQSHVARKDRSHGSERPS